jgi:hypothetical protein
MGPILQGVTHVCPPRHVLQHEPIIDEGEANVFQVLQLVKLHCLLQSVFMGDPRVIQHNHRLITIAKLDDVMFYGPPFCFHGSCKSFSTIMFVFVVVFTHLLSKCVASMIIPHIWVFVDVQEITPKLIFFFSNKIFTIFHMKACEMESKINAEGATNAMDACVMST